MLGNFGAAEAKEEPPQGKRFCAHCGTAVDTVNEDTVFGCPHCYEAAGGALDALARKEAAPEKPAAFDAGQEAMVHRLREALASEDYEQAAHLRDLMLGASGAQEGQDG